MTYAALEELVATIWQYIVRGLAIIGFIALVAATFWIFPREDKPVKTARAGHCINSACDQPCPKKPSRFTRHAGECRGNE